MKEFLWFLGSALIGILYDISLRTMILVCCSRSCHDPVLSSRTQNREAKTPYSLILVKRNHLAMPDASLGCKDDLETRLPSAISIPNISL
jgi:hypothetical protein